MFRPLLLWAFVFTITLGVCGAGGTAHSKPQAKSRLLTDTFDGYTPGIWAEGSAHGPWSVDFTGYGRVGVQAESAAGPPSKVLSLSPRPSTALGETHAALTTSRADAQDFDLTLRMKTVRQLRTSRPNPWEAAWVMWHDTDGTHFYYFTLKTNGWELGKGDPDYPGAQRFLATGPAPRVTLGTFQTVRVRQTGAEMAVSVGGRPVVSFTDRERPYLAGKFGLYTEDAQVQFDDLHAAF